MAKTKQMEMVTKVRLAILGLIVVLGVTLFVLMQSGANPLWSAASVGVPPSFQVVSPFGGEVYNAGSTQTILWDQGRTSYSGVLVDIFLKTRHGITESDYYTIAYGIPSQVGQNQYVWTIPSGFNGADFAITVRSRVAYTPPGAQISGSSVGPFTIVSDGRPTNPPDMKMLSPDGGEAIVPGKELSLTWDQSDPTSEPLTVSLSLYKYETPDSSSGATVLYIARDVPSDVGTNKYGWIVPSNLEPGYYRIGVNSHRIWPSPHIQFDLSDQVFEIVGPK